MTTTDEIIEIIKQLAAERDSFTTDEIRPLLRSDFSPRSIPAAVGKARRDGIVEEVDRVKSTIPERKGSLVPVLRGTGMTMTLPNAGRSNTAGANSSGAPAGIAAEITSLKDYLDSNGYICGVEEVATLLLLLASRTWVIIAGPSGTGKSSFVRQISEALKGKFHDIQVKPNWVSSEDSLGYFSEIAQKFIPGTATTALLAAGADTERAHFIRFDEMNLASPEYYLAELLSAGESWHTTSTGGQHSDAIQLPPAPDGAELPTIRLHPNVFLVGTVNIDETTRVLSPKVLDRSGVYELKHVDLFALPENIEDRSNCGAPELPLIKRMLSDRPHSLVSLEPTTEHAQTLAHFLSNLTEAASALGGPIGYRQRDAILTMLTLGSRHGLTDVLPTDTILDVGLRSAVMPKWQGSTPAANQALRRALISLLDVQVPNDAGIESLQAQVTTSRFPRSCEKLMSMMSQYSHLGYFSAW